MIDRVACAYCGAHRDIAKADTQQGCHICGCYHTVSALPTLDDLNLAIDRKRRELAYLEGAKLHLQRTGVPPAEARH